ncbi:MAG: hypothetical protein QM725_08410 [Lacibacter sp.]
MKYALLLLLLLNCNEKNTSVSLPENEKRHFQPVQKNTTTYADAKKKSAGLLKSYKQNPTYANEKKLHAFVADSLISFWYGTKWNFNGTTEIPGNGSIACGYFVTTVLRDAGMQINRVKLAQCSSETMIKQLTEKSSLQKFSNEPLKSFTDKVSKHDKGLFIVGLDCHTGFLYNDGTEIYFIHASYATPKIVIKEQAGKSGILAASKYRVIGKLNFL